MARRRAVFELSGASSLFSSDPLRRSIEAAVDRSLVAAIGARWAAENDLFLGATNLNRSRFDLVADEGLRQSRVETADRAGGGRGGGCSGLGGDIEMGDGDGALLEVKNINVIYNHVIPVRQGVLPSVPQGGITALLGGNPAVKTPTLKAISNLLKSERGGVTKGTNRYRGERVQHLSPADPVQRGEIQVMERGIVTVEENLLTGAYSRRDGAVVADLEIFPASERAAPCAGRLYPRGRAADARDWAGVGEPARDDFSGRARHGVGAATGGRDFWHREISKRARVAGVFVGRAEPRCGAAVCRLGSYSGRWPDGDGRPRCRSA